MSIFFEFEVGPSGRRFRRAVDDDKHDIETFVTSKSEKLFGAVDIGSLIELSNLSICMIDAEMEVLGFVALGDAPNIPGVDPADWEIWIRNMFQRYYLSRYTLFIHYMCCHESVMDFFLDDALVTIFDHDLYLNQIVLLVPPGCPEDVLKNPAIKKRNVFKFCAKRLDDIDSCHYLYAFMRHEFCPKLKMRRAVEEDNDDIVEILDKKCPRLKDLYGSYYISEIVGRHVDSNKKIIVAENQDRAVGVMCLSSDINYNNLEAMYELHPFYGFQKATPLEKEQAKRANILLTTFGEPIMVGKWSPFQRMEIEHTQVEENVPKQVEKVPQRTKKTSKVNFRHKTAMRKSFENIIYRPRQSDDFSDKVYLESPYNSRGTSYSVTDLLEEDPFDYEIVNIDTELFAVPDTLSFECLPEVSQFLRQRKLSEVQKRRISRTLLPLQMETNDNVSVVYHGEPNAFMIELFGFQDDVHDRHAFDLLEAAFEIMKDYDYCLIRVPSKDKVFPLLQHFSLIPTKPKFCSEYVLYAAHRSAVLGKLRVRSAELADIPQIAILLQTLEGQETVWTIENTILNRDQYQAYVFLSGLSIIGVGILEPPEQIDFICEKFNLDMYHNHLYHYSGQGADAGFSTLRVVVVYPTFERHYRFFAREIMRLSGSCSLLWLTAYRNKWVAHKANSLITCMIPLIPKKSEIDCVVIPELKRIANLSKKITAFSCWYLGKNMTMMPKVDVNQRIVVIGSSRTAMAFLDTLLFSDASSYLTFTNVTLISPDGLPYTRHVKTGAEKMFPKYRTSTDKFLKSVPYTYYVNVVQGTMVDIDKREKCIKLSSGDKCYYDLLFLLFGKQYQHPSYLQELYKRDNSFVEETPYVRLDVPRLSSGDAHYRTEPLPENVFVVNTIADANRAVKYLAGYMWEEFDYKVIVYGSTIEAYCCLEALKEFKVPTENIIFVEPFPMEHKTRVPVFCNVYIDQTVREVLNNLNITVYSAHYFQSWIVDNSNMVTHVEFLSQNEMVRLECSVFFYYGKIGVSTQSLNAIKRSGLVYDGGILIDHEFRTKDPSIYAAGPATRYYRRYYADSHRLKYYDSYEVGETLGTQIRNMLDPLFSPKRARRSMPSVGSSSGANSSDSSQSATSNVSYSSQESIEDKLPVLRKPIVIHCALPGGLQYLDVRPPGKKVPHYFVQSLQFNGIVMETFKSGYFKLHLNTDNIVDGITCLSPDKLSLDNFKNIYGLSATVLNNVHLRYTAKKIDDFYEFFRSNWALYLYHDRVEELFAMVKELYPQGQRKGETLRETLLAVGQTLSNPSYKFITTMRMRSKLEQSRHAEAVAARVLQWAAARALPVYAGAGAHLRCGLRAHPAFRKRSHARLRRNN